MRRVAYPPRRQFVSVAVGLLLLGLVFLLPGAPRETDLGWAVLLGLFALLVLGTTLSTLAARAVATERTLVLRALRPRRNLRVPMEAATGYAPDRLGRWYVEAEGRRVLVPVADPWELHAALALFAPKALRAKRLRPQHAPPAEEFRGLWTYDVEGLLSETVFRVVIVLALAFTVRGLGGLVVFLVAPLFFGLFDMAARIDVTDEGLVRRGPFHRREIPWADAVAIFCEPPLARRRFVVTSRETAIEIPAHLARDIDLMRKVFRSLPEGTLCVNFDDTTFRGYRRRKKAGSSEPAREELLPALTA